MLHTASNQRTSASKLNWISLLDGLSKSYKQHHTYGTERWELYLGWLNVILQIELIGWNNHISWNSEWRNVIFSDDKKFNLDGPDRLMYYWHDLRKRKLDISRLAFSGNCVMVWGAIFANGKSQLAILEGNRTAESYIRTFNEFLLPLIPEGWRGIIVYQQDNATKHKAHLTKMWLLYKKNQYHWWTCS